MAQQYVADFSLADGLTPQQIEKLNYNFHLLANGGNVQSAQISDASHNALNASYSADSAKKSAADAYQYAEDAYEAWESAEESMEAAATAAEEAKVQAGIAATQAGIAETKANDAIANAGTAHQMAVAAGRSLSEVESVVGVMEWLNRHAVYTLAPQDGIQENRMYYTLSGGKYRKTEDDPINPDKQYYKLEVGEYVPVSASEAAELDTAYERFNFDVYPVASPSAEGLSSYFVANVTESVQNFLLSHLWMNDYGLNLSVLGEEDDQYYRIHQGTLDGNHKTGIYVINPNGQVVASFGERTQIGRIADDSDGENRSQLVHVEVEPSRFSFLFGDHTLPHLPDGSLDMSQIQEDTGGFPGEVMHISVDSSGVSRLYVHYATILQDLRFGNWEWHQRPNGNLCLKWIEGVS